jgi:hypothetical protein
MPATQSVAGVKPEPSSVTDTLTSSSTKTSSAVHGGIVVSSKPFEKPEVASKTTNSSSVSPEVSVSGAAVCQTGSAEQHSNQRVHSLPSSLAKRGNNINMFRMAPTASQQADAHVGECFPCSETGSPAVDQGALKQEAAVDHSHAALQDPIADHRQSSVAPAGPVKFQLLQASQTPVTQESEKGLVEKVCLPAKAAPDAIIMS